MSADGTTARTGAPRDTVAVFDLDGTLTRDDTYVRYLAGYLRARPARLARTWALPFDVARFKGGLRDNTWLKKRFLAAILGGVTDAELAAWTARFADDVVARGLRDAAVAALRAHQARAERTVLLSASLDLFVPAIAARLGFTDCLCTVTARDPRGRLTGDLVGANCYGPEKVRRLEQVLGDGRAALHVVAYGDHRSDLPLLQWADRGVVINPSPALAATAAQLRLEVARW